MIHLTENIISVNLLEEMELVMEKSQRSISNQPYYLNQYQLTVLLFMIIG